jgi:hypothetical protein
MKCLKKIQAKKLQSLRMRRRKLFRKKGPLQIRLLKATLKDTSKIPLASKWMTP